MMALTIKQMTNVVFGFSLNCARIEKRRSASEPFIVLVRWAQGSVYFPESNTVLITAYSLIQTKQQSRLFTQYVTVTPES